MTKTFPCFLACWTLLITTPGARAYQPPITDVSASVEADDFDLVVRFEVFDPDVNEFVRGQRRYEGSAFDSWRISTFLSDQGVVAWLAIRSGDFSVRDAEVGYAVYDPVSARWHQGHRAYDASLRQHWLIEDLTIQGGRLAWRAQMAGDGTFRDVETSFAAYDPARQTWVRDEFTLEGSTLTFWSITNLVMVGRVVAWQTKPLGTVSTFDAAIGYATFDDARGVWIKGEHAYTGTSLSFWIVDGPLAGDALVAWNADTAGTTSPFDAEVGFATYDPSRQRWRKEVEEYDGESADPWTVSNLRIEDHRIRWTARDSRNLLSEIRGYNQASGSWARAPNSVYANFAVSASNGTNRLAVWFGDRSLGATSWEWDFGDGSTSDEPEPYHVFTNLGLFEVRLTVSGPAGTSTASQSLTNLPAQAPLLFDLASIRQESGQFLVTLTGIPPGHEAIVWASTDMADWQPIRTNAPGTDRMEFQDAASPGIPARFYRASFAPSP